MPTSQWAEKWSSVVFFVQPALSLACLLFHSHLQDKRKGCQKRTNNVSVGTNILSSAKYKMLFLSIAVVSYLLLSICQHPFTFRLHTDINMEFIISFVLLETENWVNIYFHLCDINCCSCLAAFSLFCPSQNVSITQIILLVSSNYYFVLLFWQTLPDWYYKLNESETVLLLLEF